MVGHRRLAPDKVQLWIHQKFLREKKRKFNGKVRSESYPSKEYEELSIENVKLKLTGAQ